VRIDIAHHYSEGAFADAAVLKLILGLGSDKGVRGVGLMMASPSSLIARTPVRHLTDFKGKKIRVLASQFQTAALERLGATPVAMSLGDVLPALQQGTIERSRQSRAESRHSDLCHGRHGALKLIATRDLHRGQLIDNEPTLNP
jgi:hypothetical protein